MSLLYLLCIYKGILLNLFGSSMPWSENLWFLSLFLLCFKKCGETALLVLHTMLAVKQCLKEQVITSDQQKMVIV